MLIPWKSKKDPKSLQEENQHLRRSELNVSSVVGQESKSTGQEFYEKMDSKHNQEKTVQIEEKDQHWKRQEHIMPYRPSGKWSLFWWRFNKARKWIGEKLTLKDKTLWDLLQIFLLPLVIWWMSTSYQVKQANLEREIQGKRYRQDSLDNYIDSMTDIIIKYDLPGVFKDSSQNQTDEQESNTNANNTSNDQKHKQKAYVANIAKAKTLTTLLLLNLDGQKRNILLDYLRSQELCCNNLIVFSDFKLQGYAPSDFELFHKLNNIGLMEGELNIDQAEDVQLQNLQLYAQLYDDNIINEDTYSINQEGKVNLLEDIRLTKSDLQQSDLRDFRLNDIKLIEANLNNAQLQGVQLQRGNLSKVQLKGASLNAANLTDAILGYADLSDSFLKGANLTSAKLPQANLKNADLSKLLVDPEKQKFKETDLSKAILTGANLHNADLSEVILYKAKLNLPQSLTRDMRKRTILKYANLENADLREAFLTGADLKFANLKDADLRGAKLKDADFLFSNLSGANLEGAENAKIFNAILCDTTTPDGNKKYRDCWTGIYPDFKESISKK